MLHYNTSDQRKLEGNASHIPSQTGYYNDIPLYRGDYNDIAWESSFFQLTVETERKHCVFI